MSVTKQNFGPSAADVKPAFVTLAGASKFSSLSVPVLRRLIAEGRLAASRIGARVLISLADLEAMCRQGDRRGGPNAA